MKSVSSIFHQTKHLLNFPDIDVLKPKRVPVRLQFNGAGGGEGLALDPKVFEGGVLDDELVV